MRCDASWIRPSGDDERPRAVELVAGAADEHLADDAVGGLPLEVEADGHPFAAVAGGGLGLVVEAHAERLEPEAPVLPRRLAQQLGPQTLAPDHEQILSLGWRELVVAHGDHPDVGDDDLRVERGGRTVDRQGERTANALVVGELQRPSAH